MFRPLLGSLLAMTALAARAEPLSVERLFSAPALDGPEPRAVALSPDGRLVTFTKSAPDDQTTFDLFAAPIEGGPPRRLIAGAELEPKGAGLSEAEKSRRERQRSAGRHGVLSYQWSEQGDVILVPAAGRLFLADVKRSAVRELKGVAPDPIDPKISPGGRYLTYVSGRTLHVLDLGTGKDLPLTSPAPAGVSNGLAEFVAQEEMERDTGQWPSPDDQRIAYAEIDERPVQITRRVDVGAEGVRIVEQRYPAAGTANARVKLFIAPLGGGPSTRVDLGPEDDIYLARVAWSKDGRRLYVQRENRPQTRLDLLEVDPATGASHLLLSEAGAPWVNLSDDFTPLRDGGFIWSSERTGFRHLYLYDREGRLVRPLTEGPWPVAQRSGERGAGAVVAVDEARGLLYFAASKESPLTRDLYRTRLDRTEAPQKITSGEGWWSIDAAKPETGFIASFTDPETPPQTAAYDFDGRRLRWIEENRLDPGHPFAPYLDHRTYPRFGALRAEDGETLYYALTLPYGFDPSRKYPAVVEVYGGPGSQVVRKTWQADTDQLLTQAGFVVFRLDNRGSPNRGMRFESGLYKAFGGVEVRDQIVGRRYLASLPFVDADRIGVQGHSYGGFMTLRLLTEPGSGFRSGVAGAPPTDWRLYDTHYTERFMGDPRSEKAAYDKAAILPRLTLLAAPGAPRLLLYQGMADDNVLFENSLRVMSTLQDLSTPFDLMLFPGERHGIPTPSRKIQLWRTVLAFFERTLGTPHG